MKNEMRLFARKLYGNAVILPVEKDRVLDSELLAEIRVNGRSNKAGRALVRTVLSTWEAESAVVHDGGYHISADMVRKVRQLDNITNLPMDSLAPVRLSSTGGFQLEARHLTTTPRTREVVGRCDWVHKGTVDVGACVDAGEARYPRYARGDIPPHCVVPHWRRVRCLRAIPEEISTGGVGYVEYGPSWVEPIAHTSMGVRWVLDIPILGLTKRQCRWLCGRWRSFSPGIQAWWCGWDTLLMAVMEYHDTWKVVRRLYDQRKSIFGSLRREVAKSRAWDRRVARKVGNPIGVDFAYHDTSTETESEYDLECGKWRRFRPSETYGKAHLKRVHGESQVDVNHVVRHDFMSILQRQLGEAGAMIVDERNIDWVRFFAQVGVLMYSLHHSYRASTAILHITQFILGLKVPTALAERMIEMATRRYGVASGVSHGESQAAGNGWEESMPLIGGTLILAIAAITAGVLPSDKMYDAYLSRFARLGQCMRTMDTSYAFGSKFSELLSDVIGRFGFGVPEGARQQQQKMSAWCEEVFVMTTTSFESTCRYNRKLQADIDRLIKDGKDFLLWIEEAKIDRRRVERFYKAWGILLSFRTMAAGAGAVNLKARPAPVIVHLVGDTGCGKSTMLYPLIAEVLAELGHTREQDMEDMVYWYKAGKESFWSGYHSGIKVVVLDDIFTLKDVPGLPSQEALDTIAMANTAALQLPMAHLADKGNVFFKAPIVIWTSNARNYKFDSLTNPEAVWNRVTLQYRVKPKQEFAKVDKIKDREVYTLDREKVARATAGDETKAVECVEFQRINPKEEAEVAMPYGRGIQTFDDMMVEVCGELTKSLERHEVLTKAFSAHMKRAVERRARVYEPAPVAEEAQAGPSGAVVGESHADEEFFDAQEWVEGESEGLWQTLKDGYLRRRGVEKFVMFEREGDEWHVNIKETTLQNAALMVAYSSSADIEEYTGPECMRFSKNPGPVLQQVVDAGVAMACGMNVPGRLANIVHDLKAFDPEARVCDCGRRSELGFMAYYTEVMSALAPDVQPVVPEEGRRLSLDLESEKWYKSWKLVVGAFGVIGLILGTALYMWYKKSDKGKKWCTAGEGEAYGKGDKGVTVGQLESDVTCKHCVANKQQVIEATIAAHGDSEFLGKPLLERLNSVKEWLKGNKRYEQTCTHGEDESMTDQNGVEIGKKIARNIYILEEWCEGEWRRRLQVVFVRGRIALANRHLIGAFSTANSRWRIRNDFNPAGFEFLQKEMHYCFPKEDQDQMRDLMVIEFPVAVQQHMDIAKYLVTKEDQKRFNSLGKIGMFGYERGADRPMMYVRYTDKMQAVDGAFVSKDPNGEKQVRMRHWYQYNIDSAKGDCGAVLVGMDSSMTRKWFGIHAGGIPGGEYVGVGQPLTLETVEVYIKALQDRGLRHASSVAALEINANVTVEGESFLRCLGDDHNEIGRSHKYVGSSGRTNIFPSPIADMLWEPLTMPAKLLPFEHNNIRYDPAKLARDKVLTGSNPILDAEVLEESVVDVKHMIGTAKEHDKVRSWKEAVSGVPGEELYPPMNRKTSPGYGWDKSSGGKRKYFGHDDVYIYDHPDVVARRDEYMQKLKRGERIGVIFEDALKDERRPKAKVLAGKTRLFSVGCQVFTVIFRQYFMGFVAHVTSRRVVNEIAVGVNVYSREWDMLARRLMAKGNNIIAGDFTNYDGTLCAAVLWGVLDVIEAFYVNATDEDRLVRMALWSEVVNSVHVTRDRCYMWTHSNPSGCPITTILNSVYHVIAVRYVYARIASERFGGFNFQGWRDHVAFICYGDDDVWSISDEVREWLNMRAITERFRELKMVYTDETKKVGEGFKSIHEVKFLKRAFRLDESEGRYVAPLDLDVIKEMPSWVRGTKNHWELASEVLKEASEELSLHDESTFNIVMEKFRPASEVLARRLGECTLLSYRGYKWSMVERASM